MSLGQKIKNTVIGLAGIAYVAGCSGTTIDANRAIEPLRQEFQDTVRNSPAEVVKTENFDREVRTLDYGGRLDNLVQKRKQYFKGKGCVAFGWEANDNKIPGGCYILCLNPFARFPEYK
jgi:hypothetical protein